MLSVVVMGFIGLIAGALLGGAASRLRPTAEPLVEKIHGLLPHTQCAQCGQPGCRAFAVALAKGNASIDQCPPGGSELVSRLAKLLGIDASVTKGPHFPQSQLAVIDEQQCIGCAQCLDACPVDAIIGAPRYLHTVLNEGCTGCGLCVPPCPVDCITLVAAHQSSPVWLRRLSQPQASKGALTTNEVTRRAA